jgi:hypothetical protein
MLIYLPWSSCCRLRRGNGLGARILAAGGYALNGAARAFKRETHRILPLLIEPPLL